MLEVKYRVLALVAVMFWPITVCEIVNGVRIEQMRSTLSRIL